MVVVRTFEVALDRSASVGDAMRRALAGLAAVGCDSAPVRVFLSDTRTGASRSCARVIKAFPELAELACVVEGGDVISSFDEGVAGSRAHLGSALEPARALALADGVPRAFPLNDSDFFFGPVPALLGAASAAPPIRQGGRPHDEVVAGEIALVSHWWISGRRTRLAAATREALPPSGVSDLPPVADEAAALLAALGPIRRERRRLEPTSPDERAAAAGQVTQAEGRLAELRTSWAAACAHLALPFALEPDASGGGFLPLRAALTDVFRPRGYRPRTSSRPGGVWILLKRTARQNELELRLHRGPINGRLSARLILCGPLWRHDLGPLPLAPGRLELCVGSEATARRALVNLAAAADAADAFLVPPLEAIHGDGFAWLTGSP
jgi:hypothetical protein